jgi:hypothetical protein
MLLLLPVLVLGSGMIKCLATYPPGEVGLQVMAANECLTNVLYDASWIIALHKGGDDDEGNSSNRDGRCSTTDIII